MIICERCLEAIESHEGRQRKMSAQDMNCEIVCGYYTENGDFIQEDEMDVNDTNYVEDYVWCEWCESFELVAECYEI